MSRARKGGGGGAASHHTPYSHCLPLPMFLITLSACRNFWRPHHSSPSKAVSAGKPSLNQAGTGNGLPWRL
jgi:hypothetical protein